MVIDMHTHIWPDKIANRTVEALQKKAHIPAYSDGTLAGLQASMKDAGVDISVILPVVTKPEQFETVNKVAAQLNEQEHLVSFGGIHPKNTEIEQKLWYIKSLGLKGIKIHPDYQQVFFDEDEYVTIIKLALEMGLIISTHAGIDVGIPTPVHCAPEHVLHVYEKLHLGDNVDNKLVLAHTGGCNLWEEVLEKLAGKKLYFDMSFTMGRIPEELFVKIIRKHGSKHILFGTDSPWSSQKESVAWIHSLPLTEEEKEDILWGTAKRLGIC